MSYNSITDMARNSKEYNRKYYQANRDKILESISVYVRCECCCNYYPKSNLRVHLKTNKHKNNLSFNRNVDVFNIIGTVSP